MEAGAHDGRSATACRPYPALPQVPPKVRRHDWEIRTHDERQRQRFETIWPVAAGCGLDFDPLLCMAQRRDAFKQLHPGTTGDKQ